MGRPRVDSKSAQILNAEDISAEAWVSASGQKRTVNVEFGVLEASPLARALGACCGCLDALDLFNAEVLAPNFGMPLPQHEIVV